MKTRVGKGPVRQDHMGMFVAVNSQRPLPIRSSTDRPSAISALRNRKSSSGRDKLQLGSAYRQRLSTCSL